MKDLSLLEKQLQIMYLENKLKEAITLSERAIIMGDIYKLKLSFNPLLTPTDKEE